MCIPDESESAQERSEHLELGSSNMINGGLEHVGFSPADVRCSCIGNVYTRQSADRVGAEDGMRTLTALAVFILFISLVQVGEAATCWVRSDGNDQYCTGGTDAAWNTDPNCAKKTLDGSGGYDGGLDVCTTNGDIIKLRSNTVEGVLYNEAPTIYNPGITIEGYGGSGRPRIGKVEALTGWSGPTDGAYTTTYNTDYDDIIWGAYIDLKNINSPKAYEHERMTLIVHEYLADLTSSATAFDANCPTSGADPNYLYLGPGFHYNPSSNVFSVRLAATPEFTSYNSDYLDLGLSTDPNNSKILVSSSEYSLRVKGASNVTLKNLQLEAARGALTLDDADTLTVDNLVIWSGFGAAVRGNGPPSNGVTIKNSYILHDTPYWLAWTDCKGDDPAPCAQQQDGSGGMRDPMIEPDPNTRNWTIEYNVIRGGHDGIATKDGDANFIIRYNVFADFADDPIELEDLDIGRFDIYGNFITNSLNCLAVGQENDGIADERSTQIDGPIHYYSNICSLARIPFVDRWRKVDGGSCCYGTCKAPSWNGQRRYGHEAAFKLGDDTADYEGSPAEIPIEINTNIYQNTIFLADSHPDEGMFALGADPNVMRGGKVFNNMFLKLNGRGGQENYHTDVPKMVDWNLYWKMNTADDPNIDLLGTEDWAGDPNGPLCDDYGFECHSVGGDPNHLHFGSNPEFHNSKLYAGYYEGLDCFGQECDGIDEATATRWMIKPGSEFMEPELFIPTAGSPGCVAGRADYDSNWPTGLPNKHVINSVGTLDPYDIGAVGCDITATTNAWVSAWDSFPFNQIWTTSTMASASVPVATITEPAEDPYEIICPGSHIDLCAEKTDTDGAAPYTYTWTFSAVSGGPCPSTKHDMCPQDVTFSYPAECLVTLTMWDRWLKVDTDTMTVNVGEVCRP